MTQITSMQVCDLAALAAIAKEHGALVCVDNSIMTPVYQRPLELGADISMISATKFIGGHSDVTGGMLSFKDAGLAQKCASCGQSKRTCCSNSAKAPNTSHSLSGATDMSRRGARVG